MRPRRRSYASPCRRHLHLGSTVLVRPNEPPQDSPLVLRRRARPTSRLRARLPRHLAARLALLADDRDRALLPRRTGGDLLDAEKKWKGEDQAAGAGGGREQRARRRSRQRTVVPHRRCWRRRGVGERGGDPVAERAVAEGERRVSDSQVGRRCGAPPGLRGRRGVDL